MLGHCHRVVNSIWRQYSSACKIPYVNLGSGSQASKLPSLGLRACGSHYYNFLLFWERRQEDPSAHISIQNMGPKSEILSLVVPFCYDHLWNLPIKVVSSLRYQKRQKSSLIVLANVSHILGFKRKKKYDILLIIFWGENLLSENSWPNHNNYNQSHKKYQISGWTLNVLNFTDYQLHR